MARIAKWSLAVLIELVILGIPVGYKMGGDALHPWRSNVTPELISEARVTFASAHASVEDFTVTAADGARLRGWAIVPQDDAARTHSPRDWVLLFHGQGDNRMGMIGFAEFLVRAGYGALMMDSRAQGESGADYATYGAKESEDAQTIVSQLKHTFPVRHLFALGVSMGAAIAIDATAGDPRIEAVAAEAPFASLQEASYDFVSGHHGTWLGRTLLWPATVAGIYAMERTGHFNAADFAPVHEVTVRRFPIFLIVDGEDSTLPPRHAEKIYSAATGPKQMWIIPHAWHASGLGVEDKEYPRRVLKFFAGAASSSSSPPAQAPN